MNKLQTAAFLAVLLLGMIGGLGFAFADSIDFGKCAANSDHHCYTYSPQLNQGGGTNTHVTIHLPQNASPVLDIILSQDNFTNLQHNIAVMAVTNIFTTTIAPTAHYCPVARLVLMYQGEPSYLNLFYNKTTGLDHTSMIYPDYCFSESGANPVNKQGPAPTPTPSVLSIMTDKTFYNLGDKITVTGTSPNQVPDIGIVVRAPNGNVVTIDQTTAISGTFSDSFQTGGTLWAQTGNYTIKATQGTNTATSTFVLSSAIPEFGPSVMIGLLFAFTIFYVTARRIGVK